MDKNEPSADETGTLQSSVMYCHPIQLQALEAKAPSWRFVAFARWPSSICKTCRHSGCARRMLVSPGITLQHHRKRSLRNPEPQRPPKLQRQGLRPDEPTQRHSETGNQARTEHDCIKKGAVRRQSFGKGRNVSPISNLPPRLGVLAQQLL